MRKKKEEKEEKKKKKRQDWCKERKNRQVAFTNSFALVIHLSFRPPWKLPQPGTILFDSSLLTSLRLFRILEVMRDCGI